MELVFSKINIKYDVLVHVREAVKFKPEYAHISTRITVRKMLHNIIIK